MVNVDWINLLVVIVVALVSGGIAYGGSIARSRAFEESTRREHDSLRREIDTIRADHKDLAHRFEACMFHHSDPSNRE